MDVSISAMNMTSHIHFVSVMDSPILTGKTLHRLGSFPQPVERARVVARRAAEEERACGTPLLPSHQLILAGEELTL